jgi:DNA gyrase subunit B
MAGAALELTGDRKITGDELASLAGVVGPLDAALATMERRGFSIDEFLARRTSDGWPMFLVRDGRSEQWFASQHLLSEFLAARRGEEPSANGNGVNGSSNGETKGDSDPELHILELHEVRQINRLVPSLETFGLKIDALLPVATKPGEEPPPRFEVTDGADHVAPLATLRELVPTLRSQGEKGQEIQRFKGLGEMNAEQLWQTTMDPARRSLMRVTVENAAAADEMFRILMGEAVEPRREFIERHALEVRNLDYHA